MPRTKQRQFSFEEVDGLKIEARTQAKAIPLYALKPGVPRIPRPVRGVSEILLENGQVMYQCGSSAEDGCGWPADNVQSVTSHRGKKHINPNPSKRRSEKARRAKGLAPYVPSQRRVLSPHRLPDTSSRTTEQTYIDRVVEVVLKSGGRLGNAEVASLTKLDYKSASDALKRAANVGSIRRVARGMYEPPQATIAQPVQSDTTTPMTHLTQAAQMLKTVAEMLDRVATTLPEIPENLEELREKAKKFDDLQELIGRK